MPSPDVTPSARKPRRSNRILAAVLGAAFGLSCVLLYWMFSFRDPLPRLSAAQFHDAQRRWNENGPPDYNIAVRVKGRQPATYRVQVRNGEPVAAFRNDRPVPQKRVWGVWSVPGMFSTMAADFRHLADVEAGRADDKTPRLGLFGVLDDRYGYPHRYRRITWSQGREESMAHRVGQSGGAPSGGDAELEVSWEVIEFAIPR